MLRSGFQPGSEVADPSKLFGYNKPRSQLENLVFCLKLGTNVQVLGERRSGKTSLLKCCIEELRQGSPNLLPVYLNFRRYNQIQGHQHVYRFILSSIHVMLVQQSRSTVSEIAKSFGVKLPLESSVDSCYEKLPRRKQADSFLEEYITKLSEFGLGVALVFDEYEHLMKYSFGNEPGKFFFLRDIASAKQPLCENAPKPLTYVTAGTTPWNELCELLGSPELNTTTQEIIVGSIDFRSFQQMWKTCLLESSEEIQERIINSKVEVERIYDLTGGWPFYAKVAGQELCLGKDLEEDLYEILSQHFNIIFSRLNPKDRQKLVEIETGMFRETAEIRRLIKRGLLENIEGVIQPRGLLWQTFLQENLQEPENSTSLDVSDLSQAEKQLRLLVGSICDLVVEVNETSWNINRTHIFECTNQDRKIEKDLGQVAESEDNFAHVVASLYLLMFERTKAEQEARSGRGNHNRVRSLERLPEGFRRNKTVIQAIDSLRHRYGKAHITQTEEFRPTMDVGKVLQHYLGSASPPKGEKFFELQLEILKDLDVYLKNLVSHLQATSN